MILWEKVVDYVIEWEEMYLLVGTFDHRIDSKGRVVLPSKFRKDLGVSVISTIGIDKCISVYPIAEWERLLRRLQELSLMRSRSRDFLRVLLAAANELRVDSAGRILVQPSLRTHAMLEQDITVIGLYDHIELWDKSRWISNKNRIMEDLPQIAEGLEGF